MAVTHYRMNMSVEPGAMVLVSDQKPVGQDDTRVQVCRYLADG